MEILIALALITLVLPVLYVISQYNRLVTLRNHIHESWSDVDTELKRRHDLIPKLVSVVKGYAAHERELLERVTALRSESSRLTGPAARAPVEMEIGQNLRQLLTIAENYPLLKADGHFLELQKELTRTEDRIQGARRYYNANVRDYRNKCEMFPSSLVAGVFGFIPEAYFSIRAEERSAPDL